MADNKRIRAVLTEAKKQSLIHPNNCKNLCYVEYINSANQILFILESNGGDIIVKQLAFRMNFAENTIRIYLRVLAELGFLKKAEKLPNKGGYVWDSKDEKSNIF